MTSTFDKISGSKEEGAPVNLFTFSGAADFEYVVERLIRSVCLIPGATEFGYGTTAVNQNPGVRIYENSYAGGSTTNLVRSMEQLLERLPNLKHVSVVVSWHGDDLRIGRCKIKPKVDLKGKGTTPYSWQVGPTTRSSAEQVSYLPWGVPHPPAPFEGGRAPAFGGAPADRSVYECIAWLKAKGLKVTVYPEILMDIPGPLPYEADPQSVDLYDKNMRGYPTDYFTVQYSQDGTKGIVVSGGDSQNDATANQNVFTWVYDLSVPFNIMSANWDHPVSTQTAPWHWSPAYISDHGISVTADYFGKFTPDGRWYVNGGRYDTVLYRLVEPWNLKSADYRKNLTNGNRFFSLVDKKAERVFVITHHDVKHSAAYSEITIEQRNVDFVTPNLHTVGSATIQLPFQLFNPSKGTSIFMSDNGQYLFLHGTAFSPDRYTDLSKYNDAHPMVRFTLKTPFNLKDGFSGYQISDALEDLRGYIKPHGHDRWVPAIQNFDISDDGRFITTYWWGHNYGTTMYVDRRALGTPYDLTTIIQKPVYPWRGDITCDPSPGAPETVDQTSAATTQVSNFFGTASVSHFGWDAAKKVVTYSGPADEWSYRRYILHLATLAHAAGADDFLIGSEMVGMNRIRSNRSTFPAVTRLVTLLSDVRSIVGPAMSLSYAADWSEWNGYRPDDSTGDIFFPLDAVWADANTNYVGIDNYMPLADWRDGTDHLDYEAGNASIYDLDYLRSNVEGGEDYDFYYANLEDRNRQVRTPISSESFSKPWVYRQKDLRAWWANTHVPYVDGVDASPTAWVPKSKPFAFTALGCPAVSRGANQPSAVVDPKSSASRFPYYSLKVRDDLMQRAFLEALLSYWDEHNEPGLLDLSRLSVWAWDARPFPDFPDFRTFSISGEAESWDFGRWLNGRINIPGALLGTATSLRYTDSPTPITHKGHTYLPLPIKPSKTRVEGALERSNFSVSVPRNSELADMFRQFRPAQPMMLTIYQGQLTDSTGLFVARWRGRVTSTKRVGEELQVLCLPSSVALARAGLTRNYQIGCPHTLYGPSCRADKVSATVSKTAVSVAGSTITLGAGWNAVDPVKYVTGLVEWTQSSGRIERRRILGASATVLTLSGPATGLKAQDTVSVSLGCNQTVQDCRDLHNNIHNCGACPMIPIKNPLGSDTNNFY